jgi:hypothetical protein
VKPATRINPIKVIIAFNVKDVIRVNYFLRDLFICNELSDSIVPKLSALRSISNENYLR